MTTANEPPVIQPIPINGHFMKAQRLKLGCTILSGSTPIKFEWFKNGHLLTSNNRLTIRKIHEESSDLIVNSLQAQDAGVYKCIVSNSKGSDFTEVNVQVKGKTLIFLQHPFLKICISKIFNFKRLL